MNAVSTEYWDIVKAEWTNLTPQERARYEDLRDDEEAARVSEVLASNAALEGETSNPPAAPPADAIAPFVPGRPLPVVESLVPRVGGHGDGASGGHPLTLVAYEAQVREEAQKVRERDYRNNHCEREADVRRVARRFKDEVSGLAKARGVLPARVVHDRPCLRGLCSCNSDPIVLVSRQQVSEVCQQDHGQAFRCY